MSCEPPVVSPSPSLSCHHGSKAPKAIKLDCCSASWVIAQRQHELRRGVRGDGGGAGADICLKFITFLNPRCWHFHISIFISRCLPAPAPTLLHSKNSQVPIHTHTHVRAHTHTNSATPGHMHMLLKTFDCSVTLLLSFTEARIHSDNIAR